MAAPSRDDRSFNPTGGEAGDRPMDERTAPPDSPPDPDWLLMQRVATGDQESVRILYARFGSLVYKTARQILPGKGEADDAVQDVFIRLWQTADRYDPARAKLVTWVMLIARRHLIDRLRRHVAGRTPGQLDDELSDESHGDNVAPTTRPADAERNAHLRARIAELPKLQRVVIERAYLQGFTLREVSEQLESPLGTVKSALSRGLAKLREDLRSTPPDSRP